MADGNGIKAHAAEISALVRELVAAGESRVREEVAEKIAGIVLREEERRHPVLGKLRPMPFDAAGDLYTLSAEACSMSIRDQLSARLSQLSAMLQVVHGGGYENFAECSGRVQDSFLWGCASLARECEELVSALNGMNAPMRGGGAGVAIT